MSRCYKILMIMPTLDPREGGPQRTVTDIALSLINQGFEPHIVTGDRIHSKFVKIKKIKVFNIGEGYLGRYRFSIKLFLWLLKNKNKYIAFTVHGLWRFNLLAARILLKNKYFVFLHGQIDPYFANNFFKSLKKKLYWQLIEKKNLLYSKGVLLTSVGEKESLNKTFVNTSGIKKIIIRYGIFKQSINKKKILKKFFNKFPMLKNSEFYLFIGRLHDKKGCDIVIESVKKLKNNFKSKVLFVGPLTGSDYELKLKNLINKYNLQNQIFILDALFGDLKWGAFQASKAMVLASHGENFGVSLVESLSFGKPVITTTKVNIFKEIKKFKAGFIANNNVESFTKTLNKFNQLKKKDLNKLKINSLNCFKKNFDLSSTKNSLGSILIKKLKHN